MRTGEYAAIILAAGFSSRMDKFKPLLDIGGETLTDRVIATYLHNGVEVILVTGWRQEELKAGIKKRGITIVNNPDYRQGMFTSIQAGVHHLQPGHKAFFIMPVDIPLVRPFTVHRLLEESIEYPESVIYPVFDSQRGHPPLIPASLSKVIKGWNKDGGLRAVLASQRAVREVKVPDSYILCDVDTPEDYVVLVKRFQHYDIPTVEEQRAILADFCDIDPERRRHCEKVAAVAVSISRSLEASGHRLDLALIQSAAALHDIAKGKSRHDIAGGNILREMGFGRVGDIVGVHSDLSGGNIGLSLEAKVVYLADKFVQGDKLVTIEERYKPTVRRFAVTPEIEARIEERRRVALAVKQELEGLIGRNLDELPLDR